MHPSALAEFLSLLPGRRVLVVGDVMLDEYLWGDAVRISAEAPVPVVEVGKRTFAAGGAANVAVNVAGLGATVFLGGVVGQDPQAGRLIEALRGHGVDPGGLVVDLERPTTTKTRLIARGQQIVRMDDESRDPLLPAAEESLVQRIERHLPEVDACVLSDYGKGVVTERLARNIIDAARDAGLPVIVDPKGTDYGKYRGATVIKPNLHEVERLLRDEIRDEAALQAGGSRLVGLLEGCAVLITRGAAGMSLFRHGVAAVHVAAVARNVFDVTGAGDTVIATLAVLLAAGAPLEQAMVAANAAAGMAVGKRGTVAVTAEDVRQAMAERDGPNPRAAKMPLASAEPGRAAAIAVKKA
jgi:D-beta-D-heptose 7-phosphate kinase/D-beta-D-heptose 1-phosphate adenosyltransferase